MKMKPELTDQWHTVFHGLSKDWGDEISSSSWVMKMKEELIDQSHMVFHDLSEPL